ncbi:NERD domain-containing protein [Heyndrickxia sporothermodurans]
MGQLIKLQDYVSRYEIDPFRYPAQYVRLKKQQWNKLMLQWENRFHDDQSIALESTKNENVNKKNPGRIKRLFQRSSIGQEDTVKEPILQQESIFQFSPKLTYYPESIEELKQIFLDQLYTFQMKWASSTVFEKSFIKQSYYRNEKLKYFLQRFPDTFLFLYEPIFLLKNAPIEMEVILITPTEVWCLVFLEEDKDSVFLGSNERFWTKRTNRSESKILNPLISLNRMSKIIQPLLSHNHLDIPLKKGIISRNGYIDYPTSPVDVELLEKRNYPKWFEQQRSLQSPLKHIQLKTAKILLDYCQTICTRRTEWNEQSMTPEQMGGMDR